MKLRVLTLRWDERLGGIDEKPLRDFLEDPSTTRDVLSSKEHVFDKDGLPGVILVIHYREQAPGAGHRRAARHDQRNWRAELDPAQKELYDALASWRKKTAKASGVAPFMICTNRQLTEVVRRRPKSLDALRGIEGIGEGKSGRWGKDIVAQIEAWESAQTSKGADDVATT